MHNGNSIIDLVKEITVQVRALVREEVQLVKAELTEKATKLGKDATGIAIGGMVAYAGLILFLGALGILAAFGLQKLGLPPALAEFVGLGAVGFIVMATGTALLLAGIKAIKTEPLAPKRTIETLENLKGEQPFPKPQPEPVKIKRSSAEIEASVLAKETQMAETLEELGDRVSLRHFREQASQEVHAHPYRWGLVAMGAGLAGSYLVTRKVLKD